MNFSKQINIISFLVFVVFLSGCKASKIKSDTKLISKKVETPFTLNLENNGVAGNTTINLLGRLEKDVLSKNADLVILMVGTNDMLNSKKLVSYDDYKLNLDKIVKEIKKTNAQVLLISPPTVDSIYLFNRHDKNLFKEGPNQKIYKVKQIIKEVSEANNTLFVDNNLAFKTLNLPVHNEDKYIRNKKNSNVEDGVHLTPLGYKLIAENVYQFLENNNLSKKYRNIICFGDSLTKGSGAKGAGTITGENYPSFLYKMLTNNSEN